MEAKTPPRHARRRLLFFGAGAAAYALNRLLVLVPGVADAVYGGTVAAYLLPPLSRLTGALPFALVEPVVAAYVGWRGWTAFRGLRAVARGEREGRHLLAGGGLVILRDFGAAVVLFYLLWGFHYARGPAADRMGLPAADSVSTEEVRLLARQTVEEANRHYRTLHGTDDAGVPTAMPVDRDGLERALHRGWGRAAAELGLPPYAAARYGSPKTLLASPLLVSLGLLGFYFPWTAEAVVNARAPAVIRGRSTAHEQAHQRGITSEGEATFTGYVAAVRSGDPLLRYSATVDAQLRLLQLLGARDGEAAASLRGERLPGVARDLSDLAAFQRRMRGPASEVATRVNDAYLRANRVRGGVRSYGTATTLLLRYARSRGGSLPGAGPERSGPGPAPGGGALGTGP